MRRTTLSLVCPYMVKTLVVASNMWLVIWCILRTSQSWHHEWWLVRVIWHHEWWLVRIMWHHVTFLPAECAQRLMRNVNYEIPALKQQIAKWHQTQRVWYTVHPPDVIHKMNTTKPFILLFYFHVLFQCKGQGVINGEAWERTKTIPFLLVHNHTSRFVDCIT